MSNKRSTFKRMLNKMKNYTRKKEQKKNFKKNKKRYEKNFDRPQNNNSNTNPKTPFYKGIFRRRNQNQSTKKRFDQMNPRTRLSHRITNKINAVTGRKTKEERKLIRQKKQQLNQGINNEASLRAQYEKSTQFRFSTSARIHDRIDKVLLWCKNMKITHLNDEIFVPPSLECMLSAVYFSLSKSNNNSSTLTLRISMFLMNFSGNLRTLITEFMTKLNEIDDKQINDIDFPFPSTINILFERAHGYTVRFDKSSLGYYMNETESMLLNDERLLQELEQTYTKNGLNINGFMDWFYTNEYSRLDNKDLIDIIVDAKHIYNYMKDFVNAETTTSTTTRKLTQESMIRMIPEHIEDIRSQLLHSLQSEIGACVTLEYKLKEGEFSKSNIAHRMFSTTNVLRLPEAKMSLETIEDNQGLSRIECLDMKTSLDELQYYYEALIGEEWFKTTKDTKPPSFVELSDPNSFLKMQYETGLFGHYNEDKLKQDIMLKEKDETNKSRLSETINDVTLGVREGHKIDYDFTESLKNKDDTDFMFEEYISNLHPDNVKHGKVDHRMYFINASHRLLYNNMLIKTPIYYVTRMAIDLFKYPMKAYDDFVVHNMVPYMLNHFYYLQALIIVKQRYLLKYLRWLEYRSEEQSQTNMNDYNVDYKKLYQTIQQDTESYHYPANVIDKLKDMQRTKNMYQVANAGDGHCFYHTILRYIYDNKKYLDDTGDTVILNNKKIKTTELLPEDFNPSIPKIQTPNTIVKLRESLHQYKLRHKYMKEGDKIDTYYRTTIEMAKQNKYLDERLYAGHIDEDEVQHMIEMLKINIIGYDSTHQMQEHWWKPYITQPYLDVDFKGDLLLHRTLIMDNTSNIHFNTLYTKDQYDTLISPQARNVIQIGGKRKKSYTRKKKKIIKKRKH